MLFVCVREISLWVETVPPYSGWPVESAFDSHVDRVPGLLQAVIRGDVTIHGGVRILLLVVKQMVAETGTGAVHSVLMLPLNLLDRVSKNFTSVVLLRCHALGQRKTGIKHVLIVLDEGVVAAELVAEFVLGVGKQVSLVTTRSHVRSATVWLGCLVVLTQVRVEGSLPVSRATLGTKTA